MAYVGDAEYVESKLNFQPTEKAKGRALTSRKVSKKKANLVSGPNLLFC